MRRGFSYQYNRYFASSSHSSYGEAEGIFPTRFQRFWFVVFAIITLFIPFVSNEYALYLLNLWIIEVIAAVGLNLLTGYTGLLSLGHAAFMGVGAYTMALLTTHFNLPILAVLPLCGVTASVFGGLIGVPSLRIKGFYLMVATVAFQFLMDYVLVHWESVTRGIRGIEIPTPVIFGFPLKSNFSFYFFSLAIAAFMVWGAKNLVRSRVGRAFMAVRDNDVSAQIVGIPVFRYKLLSFLIASLYAGVAGALWALLYRGAVPEHYTLMPSIEYLVMILVGGVGSLVGTIFGVGFILLLPEGLNLLVSYLARLVNPDLMVFLAPAKSILFGILIVIFIIFKPEGLVGVWRQLKDYFKIWPLPYVSR
ncbi:MAG: branched-chain amino acid ABC transporter permease [Deltaproteobacteria bacterium]|nr:branched-chain amino acid ABC transporter permease [Deltaproteobacteria bacterium]MBW2008922.1 branched-chain amino acid ABC transporter permease [Deltaproteobacteria bacterium]